MNIFDIMIILGLLFGMLIGWKHGFVRQIVSLVGLILVVILAFLLKNPISTVLYNYLPFFKYGGVFKEVSSINIVIYEFVAFAITFTILYILFKLIVSTTTIIDKILKVSKVLGTHSNILGALFGIIESYLIIFIVLYLFSLPIFNFKSLNESSLANTVLDNTPVLSYIIDDKLTLYDEINTLKIEYAKDDEKKELDRKLLKLLIDKKVISMNNVYDLVSKNKLDYELLED